MAEDDKHPRLIAYLAKNWSLILFWTVGLLVLSVLVFGMLYPGTTLLGTLRNADSARGLITFLIAVTTVAIAIILALFVVVSASSDDIKERFAAGKEVLTTLIGILGTIVGFYFGSAEKSVPDLDLAELRIVGLQVMTHVSGGVPPYHYSLESSDKGVAAVKDRVSHDGWIVEARSAAPAPGTKLTLDVADSKSHKASTSHEVKADDTKAPVPVPVPDAPAKTPGAAQSPSQTPGG